MQQLAHVHRDNDLRLSRVRQQVARVLGGNARGQQLLVRLDGGRDSLVEHRVRLLVRGNAFRLHSGQAVGELHVALALLVEAGDAVAHQLVRKGTRDAVHRERVAGVLERGRMARAHDGGQHAFHALLRHGLHQLGRADGRVAQARRRGDRALGVGRVVQQFDLHKMNAPRFGINSADRAHRGVSFR